jgi:transposase
MSQKPPVTEEAISRQPPEAQAIIRLLLVRISELDARVAELEDRLNKTPRNSSPPPSSQHPHAKPAPPKERSGKQRGGQPGHAKHDRALIPVEQCTDVVPLIPETCRRCSEPLTGSDPNPPRHQVWELPEIKPRVTEYQRHRLTCIHRGDLTALPMARFKQSKRRVALFLEQVLNQPCSPGWVVKPQNQATVALTPVYHELAAQLSAEAVPGIDESPTKEARMKSWLWTFVAGAYTVFALRATRAATVLDELLTVSFEGVVNRDRAKMYWNIGKPQWCWAHLKRVFRR